MPSAHNFRVDDRAVIVYTSIPEGMKYIGEITTILDIVGPDQYQIDLVPPDYARAFARGYCLRPVHDGNDPVAWSECEWQPRGIEA